jgi:hypothetical protein
MCQANSLADVNDRKEVVLTNQEWEAVLDLIYSCKEDCSYVDRDGTYYLRVFSKKSSNNLQEAHMEYRAVSK